MRALVASSMRLDVKRRSNPHCFTWASVMSVVDFHAFRKLVSAGVSGVVLMLRDVSSLSVFCATCSLLHCVSAVVRVRKAMAVSVSNFFIAKLFVG